MAKTPPGIPTVPSRGLSIPGVGYTAVWRGKLIWRAWPRKQPRPRSKKEADARKLFADAAASTVYMDSYQQTFARDVAAETVLLPRDLLMMALFGRLFYFVRPDGTKVFSVASRNDTSEVLDVIAQQVNSMLIRGENWWQELPVGPPGYVLGVNPDGDVEWLPAGAGGGGYFGPGMDLLGSLQTSTSGFASKGSTYKSDRDVSLTALTSWVTSHSAATLRHAVYEWTGDIPGSTLGALVGSATAVTAAVLNTQYLRTEFSTPLTLQGGKPYCFMTSLTTGSGTASINLSFLIMDFPKYAVNGPVKPLNGVYRWNVLNPAPGAAPTTATATDLFTYMPEGLTI